MFFASSWGISAYSWTDFAQLILGEENQSLGSFDMD